jgi:hypothetical protein
MLHKEAKGIKSGENSPLGNNHVRRLNFALFVSDKKEVESFAILQGHCATIRIPDARKK